MRIHNALDKILNHEVKTRALRIFCKRDTEWTGRQLAGELGVSPTTANKFLGELVSAGIINMKGAGRAHIYSLNKENYLVKNLLKPFFKKENGVTGAVVSLIKKALLKSGAKIESCVIFGSIAQKREAEKSDIDLLIVLDNLKDKDKVENKLDEISSAMAKDFQTAISPFILSAPRLREKHAKNAAIVNEILKAYILIMGKSPERIII